MTAKPLDQRAIIAEVKSNQSKLATCQRHEFVGIPERAIQCSNGVLYQHYRCTRCGGKVDSNAHRWYQIGLEHGKAGGK